jgi:three-Cys-motif partner protein
VTPEPYDEINYWSEVKLDIVRKYASAYSRILAARNSPSFEHSYIDAFSGSGLQLAKRTGEFVLGSPLQALQVDPPFRHYYFIDLDRQKAEALSAKIGPREDVSIFVDDCNTVLLEKVFPHIRYDLYKRALCLLDPYGLDLKWGVIERAGQMQSIEIFLNFPVMDMNRNVLLRVPENVVQRQAARMTMFWGDESWREAAYDRTGNLFGLEMKTDNQQVANAFRQRLKSKAGFKYVPEPLPMRNSMNAVVYYLYFAAQRPVATHIVTEIFSSYRNKKVE